MSHIKERIEKLKKELMAQGAEACIVPTNDYHLSEYVGDYFKCREYMTGFTGSAGTFVLLADGGAYLWTDGRYFIQAEAELAGSGIKLMKAGLPETPTIAKFLGERLSRGGAIAFDGRVVSAKFPAELLAEFEGATPKLCWRNDLVANVWADRPVLAPKPVWELALEYAGESRQSKIAGIQAKLAKAGADVLLTAALDEIAWTLNLRGDDVACCPVFLSYMLIQSDKVTLYTDAVVPAMEAVEVKGYDAIYDDLKAIAQSRRIMYDKSAINFALYSSIGEGAKTVEAPSIIETMKAVKNETEQANIRSAHIDDGVAVTRFIKWVTEAVAAGETVTELSATAKLEEFRKLTDDYLGPSFDTICAYGEHGAIVHYEATERTNVELAPRGLLLVDSGGHYMRGTTDITRTIPLGPLTDEEKKAYTLVLMGHLRLAATTFPKGTRGENIDAIAREPLWAYGMDFNHGTGHGVGYLLNVHEGPQRISHRLNDNRPPSAAFVPGMITSNEPGYYEEGNYGIRHENLLLCQTGLATESGQFLSFENLTWAPFDKCAIDRTLMSERDVELYNAYQKEVYERLAPHLHEEEKAWLKAATANIK